MILVPLYLVTMVAFTIIRGAILQLAWRWFIVPVFAAAPMLSLIDAIGLSLVVTLLTYSPVDDTKEGESNAERFVKMLATGITLYGLVLVSAVVIHAFR